MADTEQDLLDYEEDDEQDQAVVDGTGETPLKKEVKGTYVSIHSSGFRDFLLKPELLRAIVDCGFEHPSEGKVSCIKSLFLSLSLTAKNQIIALIIGFSNFAVQHECIPQAILGMDILCQAKSGMGKTAVFVLATLQQVDPVDGQVCIVLGFIHVNIHYLSSSH